MAEDLTAHPFIAGASITYSTTLLDETGTAIPGSSLSSLTLTILNPYSGAAVNGADGADILNVGRGTIGGDGRLTVNLGPGDTAKLTSLSLELRRIHLDWRYGTSVGRHTVDFALTGD